MEIFRSRHTPGLANGEKAHFAFGEKCVYKTGAATVDIIIASERMRHDESVSLGYEALFLDDYEMAFAPADRIVDWTRDDTKHKDEIAEGIELIRQYAPGRLKAL
jgi:hypothetical protein